MVQVNFNSSNVRNGSNVQGVHSPNAAENKKVELSNFKSSTFAVVRESKAAPVQAKLDKELPKVIGHSFLLVAQEETSSTDPKTGNVTKSAVYTVRVISKQAKAFRELVQIKVKNSSPIVRGEELDQVMLQVAKPIILRFDGIVHFAFMGGESLNATKVERLNVSVQEAMAHD